MFQRLGPAIRESEGVFPPAHKDALADIFQSFGEILTTAGKCAKTDAPEVARRTNQWMGSYLELGERGLKGFGKDQITPYLHIWHCHMPWSISLFGGLDKLSGEPVEKLNDSIKLTHLRRTNHRDEELTMKTQQRIELQQMLAEARNCQQSSAPRKKRHGAQHPWYEKAVYKA